MNVSYRILHDYAQSCIDGPDALRRSVSFPAEDPDQGRLRLFLHRAISAQPRDSHQPTEKTG